MATTSKPRRSDGNGSAGSGAGRLKEEFQNLLGAARDRALDSAVHRATETVGRLTDYTEKGGGPGLKAAVTGAKDLAEGKSPGRSMLGGGMSAIKDKVGNLFGGGKGKGGGQGKQLKVTNIVETIDVGVPVNVAYDQWTQFQDFPGFMKKVESVRQESDEELNWRAQILWSHRNWKSTIERQIPDQEIVWRSEGEKGYVDGAVTFHELAPNLTRIAVVLEYNPKGFFEHTGNLWRAQGRRVRLELKHFRRQVMTQTLLHPEEAEGWRGVIEDGEVVKDHETALQEEQEQGREAPEDEAPEDEYAEDEAGDEYPDSEEPTDEYPEDEEGEEPPETGDADDYGEPEEEPGEDEPGEGGRRPVSRRRPPRPRRSTSSPRPARRRSASARTT